MALQSPRSFLALPPAIRSALFRSTFLSTTFPSSTTTTAAFSTTSPHLNDTTPPPNSSHPRNTPPPPPPQSSVSPTEVSHFNALASSWWDPHGSSRLLHLMNPLRHTFIRQCLNSHILDPKPQLKFLDVGCGGGIFAESAARMPHTASVTAIDPSPEVLAVAKRHRRQDPLLLEEGRLTYRNAAVEDLPLTATPEEGYDIITVFEVVEHISRPAPFLQSCLPLLKPGGWLIGSTIARTNVSWFTTKFMAEDVLRLVPRGTHDWNQYIDPSELRKWARAQPELDAEFQGWQSMGVVYVPAIGWKEVPSSEDWGNYFFGIRKRDG